MSNYITNSLIKIGFDNKNTISTNKNSAWFLVAAFVLAAFGIGLVGAIALYCISQGMQFSGTWSWANNSWTPSVWVECKN